MGTTKAAWDVKLLLTTVSAYTRLTVAVSMPYWRHSTAVCLPVDGFACLRLPTHPHPPPTRPLPIHSIRDIAGVVSQKPAVLAG